MQKPSVGRIVHYNRAGVCLAAMVTAVPYPNGPESDQYDATLQVFTPGGGNESPAEVHHDDGTGDEKGKRLEDTWHWPERVS